MRKKQTIFLIAMLCMASSVFPQATTVTSAISGYQRVDIPPAGGVNLVGFNFTSDQPIYLEDVFGANQLVQTTGFPEFASRIYIWDGETYNTYMQKTDGFFYSATAPYGLATTEVTSGMSMFIRSPTLSTATNTISLSGTVLSTPSSSHGLEMGYTAIGNPYPTDMELNSSDINWSSADAHDFPGLADKIYIWNPDKAGGAGYDAYYLKSDRKWYEAVAPYNAANPVIPAGGGAFYSARNSFTNEITRPFNLD